MSLDQPIRSHQVGGWLLTDDRRLHTASCGFLRDGLSKLFDGLDLDCARRMPGAIERHVGGAEQASVIVANWLKTSYADADSDYPMRACSMWEMQVADDLADAFSDMRSASRSGASGSRTRNFTAVAGDKIVRAPEG